jgi:phage terminase small subunit
MSLTPKQEAFCIAYIETGNASESYRRAYSAKGMKDATVNREAKSLTDNPKITTRLAELRKPAIEKAQITLQRHLADLEALRDMARNAEKYGPAIQAEIARGKASGLYVERIGDPDGNPLNQVQPILNVTIGKS